ncbi:protein arginine N-methyltransferase 5 [Plasmodium inui San Antonio 1]|uniref:Protein arginine N-methyltransferase n=1 Tax=Plasmodium inui San Antonio 1 TaxID=1237626 RepID=W7ABM7_9APIC|nr:protein arginine N-methyltransferase 5 [Plasmodium inui San Antonio 1]EUD68698.1 protein arginine N-methyltransferase 5 [Plasmodium inui San Antonio 1]
MPLKNKYGVLKIGIEYDYSAGDYHEIEELSPDFLVTKLFSGSQSHRKLLNDSHSASNCASDCPPICAAPNCAASPCASLNTYKVDPLFGDKFEDNDIWKQNIYGFTSEWVDPDNESEHLSAYSRDALNKEMQWASYISISHLIVNPPSHRKCDNYARCINANIHSYNGVSIIVKVPLAIRVKGKALVDSPPGGGSSSPLSTPGGGESSYETLNGWNLWANFTPYCNHNFSNLSVGIELVNVQNVDIYRINLDVWKSEPVKLILLPLNVFTIDSKTGYPYLAKKLKDLLVYFFRKNIEIVLTGRGKNEYPSLNGVKKEEMYSSGALHSDVSYLKCCIYYLKRLFMSIENFDNETLFDSAYWDYLQIPLQPLKDNLPSQTYEIFEKDRTKYEQYELAISKYLSVELQKKGGGDNNVKGRDRDIIIFVVGAGRGPLVDCTLQALEKNKISKFQIYAIEKNDSAILVLRNRATTPKWKQVHVIHSDMRYLQMEKKADLIVSELLGSFGDNELFPECLDGIQKYLQEDGVSIPQNCVSYMEPISCSHIYHRIGQNNFTGYNEIFYIVNMYSYCKISEDEPAECFTFQTPNRKIQKDNSHNNRYKRLKFTINLTSYLHGFLCYFKSQLYQDVYLSIEPNTHTKNLHSWYPLYIPINQILFLEQGQTLSISIWRLTDNHKIWYEWCINEPRTTCIHNYNAKHFSIGR